MTATRWEIFCRGRALPLATSLVSAWTWLYTAALPERVRTARREEIGSDLHEQMAQDREAGVSLSQYRHPYPPSHGGGSLG